MFYYINYNHVVVGLILRKLDNKKLSNQLKMELMGELNWNRFLNFLVLSLSLEKKLFTAFLSPKVSCLYFNPNLRRAQEYHGAYLQLFLVYFHIEASF